MLKSEARSNVKQSPLAVEMEFFSRFRVVHLLLLDKFGGGRGKKYAGGAGGKFTGNDVRMTFKFYECTGQKEKF